MPLHLQPSEQAGMQGSPIFDPKGTNEYIKNGLVSLGWQSNLPIPSQYDFLGTSVDFGKAGVIIEIQFSNYPFLLNNTLRSELFFRSKTEFAGQATKLLVIVTKARMFPASNSTLYYEQANYQLRALASIFNVPIRLVGLFEVENSTVPAIWTMYPSRYARTFQTRENCQCQIIPGRLPNSRCVVRIVES